jgi:hypothetical protein
VIQHALRVNQTLRNRMHSRYDSPHSSMLMLTTYRIKGSRDIFSSGALRDKILRHRPTPQNDFRGLLRRRPGWVLPQTAKPARFNTSSRRPADRQVNFCPLTTRCAT